VAAADCAPVAGVCSFVSPPPHAASRQARAGISKRRSIGNGRVVRMMVPLKMSQGSRNAQDTDAIVGAALDASVAGARRVSITRRDDLAAGLACRCKMVMRRVRI